MDDSNYSKKITKMENMYEQALSLKKELQKIPESELLMNFVCNSLIYYSTRLKYSDFKIYQKKLKQEGFYNYMQSDNLKQKIRNIIIKHNAYLFHNYIARSK